MGLLLVEGTKPSAPDPLVGRGVEDLEGDGVLFTGAKPRLLPLLLEAGGSELVPRDGLGENPNTPLLP